MNTRLRNMTSLYLTQNGKWLLLYRVGSRVVAPSWCGIGGHFEAPELNDPRACMLREIGEEVGLAEKDLEDCRLRYVTLRLKNGEVRQNYYFFARLKDTAALPIQCSEGTLEWVPEAEVLDREMPFTAKTVLAHYLNGGRETGFLYGSVTEEQGTRFTALREF